MTKYIIRDINGKQVSIPFDSMTEAVLAMEERNMGTGYYIEPIAEEQNNDTETIQD